MISSKPVYNQYNFTRQRSSGKIVPWIAWNAPDSANVQTNVGRCFLQLINKHFPMQARYATDEIFNKNTTKTATGSWTTWHNNKVLKTNDSPPEKTPPTWPLAGACLTDNLVYKATVTAGSGSRFKNLHRYDRAWI